MDLMTNVVGPKCREEDDRELRELSGLGQLGWSVRG
jgi:hypothetical protein